jgi:subtilisin family serine protease
VLVVQAAGNFNTSACNYAYGPAREHDGILVVGGIDQNGARPTVYDNSTTQNPTYGVIPGSNFGSCVEAWAPSVRIYSTWNEPMGRPYEYLSGTSMAAPHVAGLAARYGDNSTTPVERENFIRSKLLPTGYNDGSFPVGYPIKVPSLNNPLQFTVPTRLVPASITADSTLPGSYTAYVTDSLYINQGVWNAGHPAPAWIEFDLGTTKTLKAIRMTPEQFPEGTSSHYIYVGSAPSPTTLVATISGNTATLEPISTAMNIAARYVRVYTAASSAWVAWREIEIYGY